jgi:hypothetical protein
MISPAVLASDESPKTFRVLQDPQLNFTSAARAFQMLAKIIRLSAKILAGALDGSGLAKSKS